MATTLKNAGVTPQRYKTKALFLVEAQATEISSAEGVALWSIVSNTGCKSVWRAGNGAQHFRDGRLLLNKFGHSLLQLGMGRNMTVHGLASRPSGLPTSMVIYAEPFHGASQAGSAGARSRG